MSPLFYIFVLTLITLSLMRFAPFTQRKQVKRVYFNYYLHPNLDFHIFTFINTETGISLLLLCSLAACLPKADGADFYKARKMKRSADMNEILKILTNFQNQMASKLHNNLQLNTSAEVPELKLYTPADVNHDCFQTAFNCFISELKVINHEFTLDNPDFDNFEIIFYNAQIYSEITQKGCTACEEFQEKNVTEFLKAFQVLLHKKNYYHI